VRVAGMGLAHGSDDWVGAAAVDSIVTRRHDVT
jgi:hypothetical protein